MLCIKERRLKRCFYERKDGTIGVIYHKSVLLSDGTSVRWNKKSQSWKIEWPPQFSTAVATSLQNRAMTVAYERGRVRSTVQEFFAFENFAREMSKMCDTDTIVEIVQYLK